MPLGLTTAAREALIDQRVSEALAGVVPALREVERATDQIRPGPDIDQLRRQRVPRGTRIRCIDGPAQPSIQSGAPLPGGT
jgi:hypothetical protein